MKSRSRPAFVGQGEPDAHDGQVFTTNDGKAILTVWGGFLVDTTLADDFTNGKADHMGKGWTISYQASTPGWTSYSGTKAQQVLYVREITGCTGGQYATFEFTYPSTSINATKPVVEKAGRIAQAGRLPGLKLHARLRLHAAAERVLDLGHFGDEVGDLDQFVLGVAAGDDDVGVARLVLQ